MKIETIVAGRTVCFEKGGAARKKKGNNNLRAESKSESKRGNNINKRANAGTFNCGVYRREDELEKGL